MLTIENFVVIGRGKSRGILSFCAALDGQLYEIKVKGKTVTWIYPVTRVDGMILVKLEIGKPRPECPPVAPELIAHARAVAKAAGK